jgi:hypothetical protein
MSGTIVPISDPDRGWKFWNIKEIYTGPTGLGRYVPNENDLVFSFVDGFLRVANVDYSTGLSTLVPAQMGGVSGGGAGGGGAPGPSLDGLLMSAGPGTDAESYRCYIDTSVTPHTLSVDARLKFYGTTVKYCKVFAGTNIENGEVISRQYDQNGTLLGENIPLELVLTETGDNLAIKTPMVGYTSRALPNGEVVTVVAYDDSGAAVSIRRLLVRNTSWVRTLNASTVYVTGIELECPFLSEADNRVLELPINIPLDAIHMRGVVHYSNGYSKLLPIDGTRFNFFGIRAFVSTILGQRQPCTLVYYLGENEVGYGTNPGEVMTMSESYLATTVKVDNAYSVKLFTYPVWVDEVSGYRLHHFLYNLEREEVWDATQYVEIAANSPAFDPNLYATTQNLVFAVDLSRVDSRFRNYRHLQATSVTLLRHGNEHGSKWTITYDKMKPSYGDNIHANVEFINANLWKLKVDNGLPSKEVWLRETYEKVLPLYDATSEANPPEPNMFKLIAGSHQMTYGIDSWNQELTINNLLRAGDVVYIQFIRRNSVTDLQLATVAMPIRLIN